MALLISWTQIGLMFLTQETFVEPFQKKGLFVYASEKETEKTFIPGFTHLKENLKSEKPKIRSPESSTSLPPSIPMDKAPSTGALF